MNIVNFQFIVVNKLKSPGSPNIYAISLDLKAFFLQILDNMAFIDPRDILYQNL